MYLHLLKEQQKKDSKQKFQQNIILFGKKLEQQFSYLLNQWGIIVSIEVTLTIMGETSNLEKHKMVY